MQRLPLAAGQLVWQVSTIGGLIVQYAWDTVGRVSQLDGWINNQWVRLADNVLYQLVSNRPYAWRHGNGLARLVTLDTDGRVSKLESPGRHSLSYGWDTTDTIDSITDAFYSAHLAPPDMRFFIDRDRECQPSEISVEVTLLLNEVPLRAPS